MELEKDLWHNFLDDIEDPQKAVELYSALCNLKWIKDGKENTMSWRYAGGVVAEMRNSILKGEGREDYIDYYCSGNEGIAEPWIEEKLKQLGYRKEEY